MMPFWGPYGGGCRVSGGRRGGGGVGGGGGGPGRGGGGARGGRWRGGGSDRLPDADGAAVGPRLRALAARHRPRAGIGHSLRPPAFPVDIRHNAKIGREKLAAWAATQLKEHA